jgi:hypothetical protein
VPFFLLDINSSPLIPPRYGVHPIYMDHRFNSTTDTSQSHGVFLLKYVLFWIYRHYLHLTALCCDCDQVRTALTSCSLRPPRPTSPSSSTASLAAHLTSTSSPAPHPSPSCSSTPRLSARPPGSRTCPLNHSETLSCFPKLNNSPRLGIGASVSISAAGDTRASMRRGTSSRGCARLRSRSR